MSFKTHSGDAGKATKIPVFGAKEKQDTWKDKLMLHYIFNESARLQSSPWTAPTIKSWIKIATDPSLTSILDEMKAAQALDFLQRYPQHFRVLPGSSSPTLTFAILLESTCPHCDEPTSKHQPLKPVKPDPTEPAISISPPPSCSHDELFKEIHRHLKQSKSLHINQLRIEMTQYLFTQKQFKALKELKKIKPEDFLAYLSNFSCFSISLSKNCNEFVTVNKRPFCPCVDEPRKGKLQTNSTLPHLLAECHHDELFTVVYRELKEIGDTIPIEPLRTTVKGRLAEKDEAAELLQRIEKMTKGDWKRYLRAQKPDFNFLKSSNKNYSVGLGQRTCKVDHGDESLTSPGLDERSWASTESETNLPQPLSPTIETSPDTSTPLPPPPEFNSNNPFKCTIIESWEQCKQVVEVVCNCAQVALACEGVDVSTNGKLCLVQIAVLLQNELSTFIFDFVKLQKSKHFKEICASLASILQNPNILKVMHDARQDCSALFHQLSIPVVNIFDTQVAYRSVLNLKRGTSSLSESECKRIDLNTLLEKYEFPISPLKENVQSKMNQNGSSFWKVRPLPEDLIQYMVYNVASLIPLMTKMAIDLQCWAVQSVVDLSNTYSQCYITGPNLTPVPNCLQELTFTLEFTGQYQQIGTVDSINDSEQNEEFIIDQDTLSMANLLPYKIQSKAIQKSVELKKNLFEVVMDHERPVVLRFSGGNDVHLKEEANIPEAMQTLSKAISSITGNSNPINFMSDNRLGISKMLHRISAMKSRTGDIVGLTYRVGRSVEGVTHMIKDVLAKIAGIDGQKPSSVLFLGKPGMGKTTVLREVARLLADEELNRRVVVVDTSNEIAGDGDTPHPCIGRARRVQVPDRNQQHATLIETVQNHNPQVIVVDEIGTTQEVEAVKTITQRGVAMVGTAHGEDLHTLLKNPTLRGLIGGVQPVILSANEMKLLNKDNTDAYKKSRLERGGAPTFDIVVELRERNKWRIYTQVGEIIDKLLANKNPLVETRMSSADKKKVYSIFSEERTKADWFEALRNPQS